MRELTVAAADGGTRLDVLVARELGCSRREAQRLIAAGRVRVEGRRADKGTLLIAGAGVQLESTPDDRRPVPEPDAPLAVLWVDEAVVALDKPEGVATYPLRPGERGTLANALVARYPECAEASDDPREGGLAHRLDLDTTGAVLAARTRAAWDALRAAFGQGRVDKEYLALVVGQPPHEGEIDAAIASAGRRRVAVAPASTSGALPARTCYEVLARGPEHALLRAKATTGRRHQVRVHLAHLGHPLVGDALYGGPPPPAGVRGHLLHAWRVSFPHPSAGRRVEVCAPLGPGRAQAIAALVGWREP